MTYQLKKYIRGLSFIEIMISLAILASSVVVVFGVMGRGLLAVKKGENTAIATNIARAQFEAYEGNFHMIPFYVDAGAGRPGVTKTGPQAGDYYYPDENDPNDPCQFGMFVNSAIDTDNLPPAIRTTVLGLDDFYNRAPKTASDPYYDLNQDDYGNDLLEPLNSDIVEGVVFTPVLEILPWTNGYDVNEIKHIKITVYWQERDVIGVNDPNALHFKDVTFEGYIVRTQPNPW